MERLANSIGNCKMVSGVVSVDFSFFLKFFNAKFISQISILFTTFDT